jgi:transposase
MWSLPRLSRPRRRALIREGRKSKDPGTALRFLIVAKLSAGLSRNRVAADLGTAVSSVVRTAQRFLDGGEASLYDRRRHNGQRKASNLFRTHLEIVLHGSPPDFGWRRPTWTRELLCREMTRLGLPKVAPCTMGRALASLGARLGRPKPVVQCPWLPSMRDACLARIRRLTSQADRYEPVFYVDEVDIHLNPKIGADWMLPGQQRQVVTPGKNEKRYIAGALDATHGSLLWVTAKRKNSELFCKLLWRLVGAHRSARRIHVVLDNYGIHKSRFTRRVIECFADQVVLHFLPPYCPDDNRIERVWLDLHANVTRNHRCADIHELMLKVASFLYAYNQRHRISPSLRRTRSRRSSCSIQNRDR